MKARSIILISLRIWLKSISVLRYNLISLRHDWKKCRRDYSNESYSIKKIKVIEQLACRVLDA